MTRWWGSKANLKFVSLYEQNTCLWKTDCPTYKNRDVREMAIDRMVKAMALPDFRNLDCKNKIKNVRSHYIQELKKIKRSRRLSPMGEPTYEPKLSWFAPLDRFLRPHILTLTKVGGANQRNRRSGGGVEDAEEDAEEDATTTAWLDSCPDDSNEVHVDDASPPPAIALTNYAFPEDKDREPEDWNPRKRKAMVWAEAPSSSASVSQNGPDLIVDGGQTANLTPEQKDSEFEAFGRSIAAQLKNMPFHVALQLQLKIQTIVTEERLRLLRSLPPD